MNKNVRHAVRVFAIKNGQIVCIKYKNINKDFFDIPGGKIEDGETAIEACIREFKEETGMDIDDVNFMGKVMSCIQLKHLNLKYIVQIPLKEIHKNFLKITVVGCQ